MRCNDGRYGTIVVAADGFAKLEKVTEDKPTEGVYVKSKYRDNFVMPIDRYYMDEKMAPKAERLHSKENREKKLMLLQK